MNKGFLNRFTGLRNVIAVTCILLVVPPNRSFGQSGSMLLRGLVKSHETGQPLARATVIAAGNTKSQTDLSGRFAITIPAPEGQIAVSSVGYRLLRQDYDIRKETFLIIELKKDSVQLQEVIISSGYQRQSKEQATGSYALLDNRQINAQYGPDILSRLEGMTSSVNFDKDGQRPGFTVRGISSINASKEPLIVLDNFPYSGDISNINPNDIENVTVLRDAAASSIWGAKAGNGVIVITTKTGRFNRPLTVNVNSNITVRNKPDIFGSRNFISSSDFIDLEKFLYQQGYYQGTLENTYNYPVVSPVIELLAKRESATLSEQAAIDQQIEAMKIHDVRSDIDQHLYQKQFVQQYALNVNGGGDRNSYYLSGGYDRTLNYLAAANERISFRGQNSFRFGSRLNITAGAFFSHANSVNGRPEYTTIRVSNTQGLYPYAQLADADGNPLPVVRDYRKSYLDTVGSGKLSGWNYYPLEDYKYTQLKNQIQDMIGNISVDYNIFAWLKAQVKYQYQRQDTKGSDLYRQESYYTRDLINKFSQINAVSGNMSSAVPAGSILDAGSAVLNSTNLRGQLELDKSWGISQITALFGAEQGQVKTDGAQYRTYGYNEELGVVNGVVDPTTSHPLIYGGSATIPNANTFYGRLDRSVSWYGNASYLHDGKYTLSASIRKDQSNLFGVNANQKGRPFWSAGASWNVSRERFFNIDRLTDLKLRFSYGFSGNADNSLSALTAIAYTSYLNSLTGFKMAVINKFANPDLRWEKTGMANFGLDFAVFDGRIRGTVDYYKKKGTDLLGDALTDITTGLKTNVLRKNVASMKGEGLDMELNSTVLSGAVKWNNALLFSYNRNTVTKYYLSTYQGSNYITHGNLITPVEERPVYSLYGYRWAGLDPETGDPIGYLDSDKSKDYTAITGTGTTVSDLVYGGSATPVFFGAFRNTFSYRNFEMSFNIVYKLGHYFRKSSVNYTALFYSWQQNADYSKRWQQPGDEQTTSVPSLVYPADANRDAFYSGSELLIERADHIRLQYASLSYSFKDLLRGNVFMKDVSVKLLASDLGILWRANSDVTDPDYPYGLTPPKTFSFGVTASF